MSKADDLRGKLSKSTTKPRTRPRESVSTDQRDTEMPPEPHEVLVPAPQPRAKPVRITVDLPPSRHDDMKRWNLEAARELGRSRITAQDLVNTLVHRVLSDETLSRKIRDDLRNQ